MIEPILIGMSKSVHRWRGKLKSKIWFTSAIAQVDAQQRETLRPIREKPAPQD
jgi:hypothetical protein